MLSRLWRRVSYLWLQRQRSADLTEELEFHRAMKQAELERAGVADAGPASQRALGNQTLAREEARAVWGWRWIDDLARDVTYAQRNLRRHPRFAFVAITTLALGIGVTSAVFSLLYAAV